MRKYWLIIAAMFQTARLCRARQRGREGSKQQQGTHVQAQKGSPSEEAGPSRFLFKACALTGHILGELHPLEVLGMLRVVVIFLVEEVAARA